MHETKRGEYTYKYSEELIERLQKYLVERKGVEITKEEADMYLDNMAELYGVFTERD